MTDEIISRDMIAAKARSAFQRGAGRDDHGFNPGAPAIEAWQQEWDRLDQWLRNTLMLVSPP